jgi:hypothetical protein
LPQLLRSAAATAIVAREARRKIMRNGMVGGVRGVTRRARYGQNASAY